MPSYHDLHITTASIPRKSVFDLPYNVLVTCTRAGGWELWRQQDGSETLLAGEYETNGLKLDVDGHVIIDSLKLQTGQSQQGSKP